MQRTTQRNGKSAQAHEAHNPQYWRGFGAVLTFKARVARKNASNISSTNFRVRPGVLLGGDARGCVKLREGFSRSEKIFQVVPYNEEAGTRWARRWWEKFRAGGPQRQARRLCHLRQKQRGAQHG